MLCDDRDQITSVPRKSALIVAAAKNLAFVFDIDGVLVNGAHAIAEGHHALHILNGDNSLGIRIPYILLTNGGGNYRKRPLRSTE